LIGQNNLAGGGADEGTSISVDVSGNIYTAGYFTGTSNFDPTSGTINLISAGGSDFFIHKMSQIVGLEQFTESIGMNMFPNPARDHLIIEFTSKDKRPMEGSFSLSNINGREVLSQPLRTSKETLNLTSLPPGIYFAKIEVNGVVEYRKVVKE